MGLTTQRALCHVCIRQGRTPADAKLRFWVGVGFGLSALAAIATLLWSAWH